MKTKKAIILVLVLSLLGKLLGFIRDILITNYLGFGAKTDGLLLSLSIITISFSTFNTMIRTTFSPLFSSRYFENRHVVLKEYNNIRNILVSLSICLFLVFLVFNDYIIKVFAPGLNDEAFEVASLSLKFLSILLILYILYYITTGFLQSIKIFTTVETANLFNNLTIILLIITLYQFWGLYSILVGYVLGAFFQVLYSHYVFNRKVKYKLNFKLNFKSDSWKNFVEYSKFILLGSFVSQLTVFGDKFVASFLDEGSISALHYATLIRNLPLTMVILAVTNVLFTNLSISYTKNTPLQFKNQVLMQSKYLLYLILPFILILFVFSEEIIKILFYRGEFTLEGVQMTSVALKAYSIGMFFWVLKEIFSKVSYAAKNTKIPLVISIISFAINFILNFVLGFILGHIGIAIATSFAIFVNSMLIILLLKKRGIVLINLKDLLYYLKSFLFLILMLFVAIQIKKYLLYYIEGEIIILLLGCFVILILWLSFSKILGVNVKEFFNKRK